jgi:dUTP pyrophosphatase
MTAPPPYYTLRIYLNEHISASTHDKYICLAKKRRKQILSYIQDQTTLIDAGIDLFVPKTINITNNTRSNKLDMGIVCSMTYHDSFGLNTPCGFYLYPRSSTGSKTPLRLSNSVGIIDAGYRGNIIACFDNIDPHSMDNESYQAKQNDRLVQICAANLIYPISVEIVSSLTELDYNIKGINTRGTGGFGSTGN